MLQSKYNQQRVRAMSNREITGHYEGEEYLCTDPVPLFNLTWTQLWRLFMLRLNNPKRADGFKFAILDYNMRANRS